MTFYNVHVYREMRLFFPDIEAPTPEEAAAKVAGLGTAEADEITSCDGENFAAPVDVVGDDEYEYSVTIDFEPERLRRAAQDLLEVCETLARRLPELDDDDAPLAGSDAVQVLADLWPDLKAAIAKATGRQL